jgi:hypothetical protein
MLQGAALPALYWPVDNVVCQTPGRLRPGNLSLVDYNTSHVRQSTWSESTDVLSCTPSLEIVTDKVILEPSRRSLGGRVGRQLDQLGPMSGRLVFW